MKAPLRSFIFHKEIPMNAIFAISESATNRQPKAWPIGKRAGGAIVATLVLFGARGAHADAVTDWNAIMETTVMEATPDPFLRIRSGTPSIRSSATTSPISGP
ncbi:MAG: hypothetical protein M3461_17615 [Pseudomonadota bacterium]|nr:hypothetical protein [Pseudomonadota bacterium]